MVLIDEKVRFVIAGIVNMAIRYLIFVLLGLAFSVSRYQLVLLATWLLSSVIAFFRTSTWFFVPRAII